MKSKRHLCSGTCSCADGRRFETRGTKLKRSRVHIPGQWQPSLSSSGWGQEEIKRINEISPRISRCGFWWQSDRKRQNRWCLPKRLTGGLWWTAADLGLILAHRTLLSIVLREGALEQTKQINKCATWGSVDVIRCDMITDLALTALFSK